VLNCNRKAKSRKDRIQHVFSGHHGPVYALQRHPFYSKYFLSVGDWTARVWSDELQLSPIITTKYHPSYLTDGARIPSTPSHAPGSRHVARRPHTEFSPPLLSHAPFPSPRQAAGARLGRVCS